MNALDLLKTQHQLVDDAFEMILKADGEEKEALFAKVADDLFIHAKIEEEVFYPGVKAADTQEILEESVKEHFGVKQLLAQMIELDVDEEEFDDRLGELIGSVRHHVEEEENELFLKVQEICTDDQLAEMATRMQELERKLRMDDEPRMNITSEISAPAQI